MSRQDDPAPMDPVDQEPKHRVFLCHSGAQKDFVAQLDADLRNMDRYPFFDTNRDALPVTEPFPDLIFKAIECCQVGVVILTDEFFMRSHWPMFEVVKMVKCGRKIMPVFLGISPEDLSNEGKVATWTSQWREWAISNKRIDIPDWEGALKYLRPLTGLKYKHAAGAGYDEGFRKDVGEFRKDVVKFRKDVVQEICKVVPAFHTWDDSHVQGKSRLSKVILKKITNTPMCRGARVVGLYGVGGIGKTTACQSLCKDQSVNVRGRVCHLEFKNDVSEEDRVREALKRLTGTNKELLKDMNLNECWSQLKNRMRFQKVVLAIDNVSSISKVCDEARKYLTEVEYFEGSIVMVTARALDELGYVCIDKRYCLPMPELVEDEAKALFLDYAKRSMKEVEQEVLRHCIKRCYFCKGDGKGSHYLPLALKVLGSQLVGRKPSEWVLQLKKEDVFNLRGEPEDPVYSVLRSSFVDLKVEYQLLFMDVALFDNKDDFSKRWRDPSGDDYHKNGTMKGFFISNSLAYMRTWYIFDWLSMVHGIKVDVVKERLNVLRERSLLEEVGDGLARLGMHDLWRGFAVMETNRGEKESWSRVYEVVSGVAEESSLSGGGWENLRRICIMRNSSDRWYGGSVKRVNFTYCSKVTVLKLNLRIENQTLDLSPLQQLISLEIDSDVLNSVVRKVSGLGQLTNLAALVWLGIDIQSRSAVEEISRLTNLQVLQLTSTRDCKTSTMTLNLKELVWLREVRARFNRMVFNICLSSEMTSLRMLDLGGCKMLGSCTGVGDVVGLEVLVLNGCRRLKELPNLEKLTKLRQLHIQTCCSLEALPGLGSLVALQELRASFCYRLRELPDVSRLAKLEVLDLDRSSVRCIPGLGDLVALRDIVVDCSSIDDWPDCGNLTKLQVVSIRRASLNLAVLEFASALTIYDLTGGKLTNLSKLTALKNLILDNCNVETLPDMGKDMCLESLKISGCRNLRRWDGVERQGSSVSRMEVDLHCSWTLPQLVNLEFWESTVIELPDLTHFPRLRTLSIQHQCATSSYPMSRLGFAVHCHAEHLHLESLIFRFTGITSLPDLRKFLSLKVLEVAYGSLSSLTTSGPLTALESLELMNCESLEALPGLDLFPKLHSVELYRLGGVLTAREVLKLEARGFRCSGVLKWTTKPMPRYPW